VPLHRAPHGVKATGQKNRAKDTADQPNQIPVLDNDQGRTPPAFLVRLLTGWQSNEELMVSS